jgi:hypothetical protein
VSEAVSRYSRIVEQHLPDDPNDVVKAFAANSAFRAAEWEELTTEGDPYRRPVRPDDLAWLDYAKPMPVEKALRLSALLGHRMLRNIYDADLLYLPPADSDAARADRSAFYCDANRVLSALAKPVLERHLFTLLDGQRPEPARPELGTVIAAAQEYLGRRTENPGAAFDAVSDTKGKKEATTFLMVQLTAILPAMHAATGRMALGEYGLAHPGLREILLNAYHRWEADSAYYTDLLAGAELRPATAAYWQLYLSTSLARGNYLHYLATNREHAFAFLGAFVQQQIDRATTAQRYTEVFTEGLGGSTRYFHGIGELTPESVRELVTTLLRPLVDKFGDRVLRDFHRGFSDAVWLAELWDTDLATQVGWADKIEEYQQHAVTVDRYLTDNNITVDLDTFVESNEETSTTHVHDEHRLVMIEVGQMHFWNNVTHKIELNQGDKLLIPVSRLHGSTVLSGECTYHQPIIPDEMLRELI